MPDGVKHLVVDGYYAKLKFVNAADEVGLETIGKLRHDANLRYLYDGPQKKDGARRKYDGKLKFDDLRRLEYVDEVDKDIHLYTAVVYSVSLKRKIRLVYVLNLRNKKKAVIIIITEEEKKKAPFHANASLAGGPSLLRLTTTTTMPAMLEWVQDLPKSVPPWWFLRP